MIANDDSCCLVDNDAWVRKTCLSRRALSFVLSPVNSTVEVTRFELLFAPKVGSLTSLSLLTSTLLYSTLPFSVKLIFYHFKGFTDDHRTSPYNYLLRLLLVLGFIVW
jgi:hypothetical protein